jgi:integrase
MSVYKRGGVWWFKFKFQGVVIRESTGLTQKEAARDVERKRHLQLKEGRAGIERAARLPLFSVAADAWLKTKTDEWAAKTTIIEKTNLSHLKPFFGNRILSDISPADVGAYRAQRLKDKAAHKTVALEIGTLRGIMLFYDLDAKWRAIRKKVKLKKARKLGRLITPQEEAALLRECQASRSRSLPVAVTLAFETAMRYSEIRLLQWRQIDFTRRVVTVGESKTEAGTGREIPLSSRAKQVLTFWAANFPNRKPNHYVFPFEKYGGKGADEKFGFSGSIVYGTDTTRPIGDWKESWELAKKRAGVNVRFHDTRHSACSRMLEAGVSHPVVAEIMGWSASTAIRMIKEVYGHIGLGARRRAIEQLEKYMTNQVDLSEGGTRGAQKGAQLENHESEHVQ